MSLATAAAGDENPNILPEVKEIKIQFLLCTALFGAAAALTGRGGVMDVGERGRGDDHAGLSKFFFKKNTRSREIT